MCRGFMTRFHSLSCLSTLWNVWLATKFPFSYENILLSSWKKRKIESVEHVESRPEQQRRNLTSYVTSSPRSASVMRILEIFSQGPWSTRVTSGCSSSRSRVLSLKTQKEPNDHEVHAACPDCMAVKRMPHLQTRGPYKAQTPPIYSPPSNMPVKKRNCTRTWHFFKLMCMSVYPELVQQQVKDLFGGHRAVDSYVSDRAVRWSEHWCLGEREININTSAAERTKSTGTLSF